MWKGNTELFTDDELKTYLIYQRKHYHNECLKYVLIIMLYNDLLRQFMNYGIKLFAVHTICRMFESNVWGKNQTLQKQGTPGRKHCSNKKGAIKNEQKVTKNLFLA